jgi:hypothetical protein
VSAPDIAEPVDLVDPTGTRRAATLSPAGHVAPFVRAIHAPAAAALRRRAGRPGLVEACAVTRGRDGRPRPHRSGESEQFHRCGDLAALQALASATRAAGRECWCSVLPRTETIAGGKAVAGGTLLWADVDTPGTLWRAAALRARLAVRLVVESGGASDPHEPRWHLYLVASRWLDAPELEATNARLAGLLGGDRVGDRGRLMRLPATRNLKGGWPGRWCRVVACDLHAPPLDVESAVGPLPRQAPPPARSARDVSAGAPRGPAEPARPARVVRAPRARPPDKRVRLRPMPAARRPCPLAEALRRAARRLVLLGVRTWRRPHRVCVVALARASQPRPRRVRVPRARRALAGRARHPKPCAT